ncbi:MAG TPA: hypothetical protein VIM23_03145 [Gaiellaceae bacterium]|jgi:hypothetical protein
MPAAHTNRLAALDLCDVGGEGSLEHRLTCALKLRLDFGGERRVEVRQVQRRAAVPPGGVPIFDVNHGAEVASLDPRTQQFAARKVGANGGLEAFG